MPYRAESWLTVFSPPAFTAPSITETGDVATVGLHDDEPVGYLLRAGDALEWYSQVDPSDGYRGGIRQSVEEIITKNLREEGGAVDVWMEVTDRLPIAEVELDVVVQEFHQQLRVLWDATDPA